MEYGRTKGERREARAKKKRFGMQVRGRGIFVLKEIVDKRAQKARCQMLRQRRNKPMSME